MNVEIAILITTGVLSIISILGLVYSFIRKKSKNAWVVLILIALLFPIVGVATLMEDKKVDEEAMETPEPVIDESGVVHLKEGEHTVGGRIPEGIYNVEVVEKYGEIFLDTVEGQMSLLQMLGLGDMTELKVHLSNGDKLRVDDDTRLTPIDQELRGYEEVNLYPGIWHVGEDITEGSYRIGPTTDTVGDVYVVDEDGRGVYDARVGIGEMIDMDLYQGDRLRVVDMNFKLEPIAEQ